MLSPSDRRCSPGKFSACKRRKQEHGAKQHEDRHFDRSQPANPPSLLAQASSLPDSPESFQTPLSSWAAPGSSAAATKAGTLASGAAAAHVVTRPTTAAPSSTPLHTSAASSDRASSMTSHQLQASAANDSLHARQPEAATYNGQNSAGTFHLFLNETSEDVDLFWFHEKGESLHGSMAPKGNMYIGMNFK